MGIYISTSIYTHTLLPQMGEQRRSLLEIVKGTESKCMMGGLLKAFGPWV